MKTSSLISGARVCGLHLRSGMKCMGPNLSEKGGNVFILDKLEHTGYGGGGSPVSCTYDKCTRCNLGTWTRIWKLRRSFVDVGGGSGNVQAGGRALQTVGCRPRQTRTVGSRRSQAL